VYLRFHFNLDPNQFCYLCGPVRMLAGAQDYRAYADLFVVSGEDGGYGGQVSTSGKWVRWMRVVRAG
jgi:hypothetical protein